MQTKLTITSLGAKYQVSTGDGTPVKVRSIAEIAICVEHYFGGNHGRDDWDRCALCRSVYLGR